MFMYSIKLDFECHQKSKKVQIDTLTSYKKKFELTIQLFYSNFWYWIYRQVSPVAAVHFTPL